VETFEQVVYLRDAGVAAAQGYVFAPPLPGSSYLPLIEAADPAPAPAEQAMTPPSARNRFEAA
jgi:EAL domain-containing protein (putative c-di-GMP-specific phosphodiesterase class I)